ncbi:hypothetical protein AAOGI_26420 [Agarivorans albus]|uniref:Uncharacterized protein n=1 Tax=Agarivorans albus MKT 106 TaxID=1331007 RepID=R9PNQ9_AGAAL|nr:hypothetical protein AALB_3069 [Agarivorans albus MKT 106]
MVFSSDALMAVLLGSKIPPQYPEFAKFCLVNAALAEKLAQLNINAELINAQLSKGRVVEKTVIVHPYN